jgi:hypothetical protein
MRIFRALAAVFPLHRNDLNHRLYLAFEPILSFFARLRQAPAVRESRLGRQVLTRECWDPAS